jgi:transglutaminase-like putative cysteine protease
MKKYEFTFSTNWVFDAPVSDHHYLLRCMPGTYSFQRTYAHKLTVSPFSALSRVEDGYGNELYSGSLKKAHSSFGFTATGFVLCSKYLIHEPLDRLFLYPSDFTHPDSSMKLLLSELELAEEPRARALQLCRFVHEIMEYDAASPHLPATEALLNRRGASRDFVHIYLTLCHMARLPARYVVGLCPEVTRAHVWAEVYLDGAWYAMDPTRGVEVEEGYLKIAHGRDYADCAVDRFFYHSQQENVGFAKTVSVKVTDHVITTRDTVPHA